MSAALTPKELAHRMRLKEDFPFYARHCLFIRTKNGELQPFKMNRAQMHIHEQAEKQRHETGRVRAIILKGRQQGMSTYVQGRLYWRTTHSRGVRAFILTHEAEATKNLFEMAQRYHENAPPAVRPHTAASSAKELLFDKLDSGYRVGTAGNKDVGRSMTVQLFHGSEVAYWPNAQAHLSGVMQTIADAPGTEIFLESTSAGPDGVFYDVWRDAEAGLNGFIPVFVPWFWQDEYATPVGPDFEMSQDERNVADEFGLTPEQVLWRRKKISQLGSLDAFKREYPNTAEEAFATAVDGGVLNREWWKPWYRKDPPKCDYILQCWDTANTQEPDADAKHQDPDFSARTTWGVFWNQPDGDKEAGHYAMILLEAWRGRVDYPNLRREAQRAYQDQEPDMVEIEYKASGQQLVQDFRRAGLRVRPYRSKDNLVARARVASAMLEAGRVYAPAEVGTDGRPRYRPWAEQVINECGAFPLAKHDDYVSSCAIAWARLRQGWHVEHPEDPEREDPAETPKRRLYW